APETASRRSRDCAAPRDARSRARRAAVRRGRGDVRRPHRRAWARGGSAEHAAPSVHGGVAREPACAGPRAPRADRGIAALALGAAGRMQLPRSLPSRAGRLRHDAAGIDRRRRLPSSAGDRVTALLEVEGLRVGRVLNGISFTLQPGEFLAITGESGSGKSTLARAVLRLIEPEAGSILFRGKNLLALPPRELRALRREM